MKMRTKYYLCSDEKLETLVNVYDSLLMAKLERDKLDQKTVRESGSNTPTIFFAKAVNPEQSKWAIVTSVRGAERRWYWADKRERKLDNSIVIHSDFGGWD